MGRIISGRERLPAQMPKLPGPSSGFRAVCTKMKGRHEGRMRHYTTREKLKITAGAVASLVIVGWALVLAIAFLSAR
jgi:hypothetical protein